MMDTMIETLIKKESERQKNTISLIASENYASLSVRSATGSTLTNKYAEGYPGKRYYAGCSVVDEIEQCAIERAQKLFNAQHANVQPHAGSQANMAAYYALLTPGDTIMGMDLMAGGHLTHGHTVNFSGTWYKTVSYGVDPETECINMESVRALAHQHRPRLIIAGASAYSRIIDFKAFADIAQEVGAFFISDIAHIAGLVAANLHPSPVPYADVVTTTTHKTLRGPRGGLILSKKEHATAIDRAVFPGLQGGPCMNVIAAKAVCFYEAALPTFHIYQQQVLVNAQTMAHAFKERGYRIVADKTENHLFVLDLRSQGITGHEAQKKLEATGIIVSKSCIPYDPEKPWITSGIRIGTPAITTRGFTPDTCQTLVDIIDTVLRKHKEPQDVSKYISHILETAHY